MAVVQRTVPEDMGTTCLKALVGFTVHRELGGAWCYENRSDYLRNLSWVFETRWIKTVPIYGVQRMNNYPCDTRVAADSCACPDSAAT